jgi:serine/threonine protein kinase
MPPPNADDPLRTTDATPDPAPAGPAAAPPADGPGATGAETRSFAGPQATGPDLTGAAEETPEAAAGRDPPPPAVPGYEVEAVLGRGGMGVVYKARDLALKRTIVLRMVLVGGRAGPREWARFRIEAAAWPQHPNIVQVFEVGEAGGHPHCALEFVEGGSLAGRLASKPLPAREATKLVESLARAYLDLKQPDEANPFYRAAT